jgi:hypothetical protein
MASSATTSAASLHGLELLTRVPFLRRLDVFPFAVLYALAARASQQLGASLDATYARFQLAPLVLAVLLHALALLAQQWSVRAKRIVGFARAASAEAATHVFVPGHAVADAAAAAAATAALAAAAAGGRGGAGGAEPGAAPPTAAPAARAAIAALVRQDAVPAPPALWRLGPAAMTPPRPLAASLPLLRLGGVT